MYRAQFSRVGNNRCPPCATSLSMSDRTLWSVPGDRATSPDAETTLEAFLACRDSTTNHGCEATARMAQNLGCEVTCVGGAIINVFEIDTASCASLRGKGATGVCTAELKRILRAHGRVSPSKSPGPTKSFYSALCTLATRADRFPAKNSLTISSLNVS
ncbi:MAG: hypothetical protein ACJAV4_000990 [Pontimonas sp.]